MKKDNNLLDYVPLIAQQIQWSENEDTIVTVDVVNKGMFNRIAQVCFGRPKSQPYCIGRIWKFYLETDRRKTYNYDIAMLVQEQFGEKAEPLYDRLLAYFRTLQGHGFIVLQAPENK